MNVDLYQYFILIMINLNIINGSSSENEKANNSHKKNVLVLWSILICWDSELVFFLCEPKSSQLKEPKT